MNISVHLQLAVNNNCDEGLSLNCGSLRNIYCVLSLQTGKRETVVCNNSNK